MESKVPAAPFRGTLFLLAFIALVSGAIKQATVPAEPYPTSEFLSVLVSVGVIFAWFRADANKRNYRRSPMLNTMVVGLAFVALPYYFFKSRGPAGGVRACLLFFLAFVGTTVLSFIGAVLIVVFTKVHRA